MTPAGSSDRDRILEATDLVALVGETAPLQPKGREHVGLCPFHEDRHPSLAIVTHKGNAFFKCHACGASGSAFDYVMRTQGMDFREALVHLADRAGIELTDRRDQTGDTSLRAQLRMANSRAASFFQRTLADPAVGGAARALLADRGVDEAMVERFGLGAAPERWDGLLRSTAGGNLPREVYLAAGLLRRKEGRDTLYDFFRNRLLFPIMDETGRPIAFGGRRIARDDEPKYLNSTESELFHKSSTLYALHLARPAIVRQGLAIVVEGYTDVIACHQAGIEHVVATLGTALTLEHARTLGRLCSTVVLVFDGDTPGLAAAERAVEIFLASTVDVRICVLGGGDDPADIIRRPDGAAHLEGLVASAIDSLQYKVDRLRSRVENEPGISGRQRLVDRFAEELDRAGFGAVEGVRRSLVITGVANLLDVKKNDIEALFAQASGTAPPPPDPSSNTPPPPSAPTARQQAEREYLALLLYDPGSHLVPAVRDGRVSTPAGLVEEATFADPSCRRIAAVILPHLAAGHPCTVQEIQGTLEEEADRELVGALWFDGERRCDQSQDNPAAELTTAAQTLRRCLDQAQAEAASREFREGVDDPDTRRKKAREVVESRKTTGGASSAITRRRRT